MSLIALELGIMFGDPDGLKPGTPWTVTITTDSIEMPEPNGYKVVSITYPAKEPLWPSTPDRTEDAAASAADARDDRGA